MHYNAKGIMIDVEKQVNLFQDLNPMTPTQLEMPLNQIKRVLMDFHLELVNEPVTLWIILLLSFRLLQNTILKV